MTPRPFDHPAFDATDEALLPTPPVEAHRAQPCRCEDPQTYRDEDGDLRCTCGRAVAP